MTYKYTSGLGNVGAFQVSGKPFVSGGIIPDGPEDGSQYEIQFPNVTSWIEIRNQGDDSVSPADAMRWPLKCTSIFLSGSSECSVIAGLTGIPTGNIALNYSGSSGIG